MNTAIRSLILSIFAVGLAVHAATSDDMLIYSDQFNNGWGDSWSWMPTRYATNNPVYAGTNSMALVPSGQFQAWWLKSATSVDATIYTDGDAAQRDEWRGVLPVGAALLARHRGIREHLNPN